MRKNFTVYVALFVLSGLVFAYAGLITAMTVRAMKCNQSDRPEDAFVMYCNSVEFADYEHGAFFYEYEPKAIEYLKKADVVMLGTSRMMYAMTVDYSDKYMASQGIKYYQFGFGYQQLSDFPLALIKRYRLNPKVLIVGADPFFAHAPSGPAKGMLSGSILSWLEYSAKRSGLMLSRTICAAVPDLCKRQGAALYRGYETGRWRMDSSPRHDTFTRNSDEVKDEQVERTALVAEDFLSHLSTPKECIIFTGIPSPGFNPDFTARLAKRLGVVSINAIPSQLASRDENHIDPETALSWQKEFLPKALPVIKKCLAISEQH